MSNSRKIDEIKKINNWLLHVINENYLKCNFGTLSKSDLELLVFKYFIEKENARNNNKLDFYELSKKLGITEVRFNNLYQRLTLRNLDGPLPEVDPDKIYIENYKKLEDVQDARWKNEFISLLSNLKFDKQNSRFKLLILDPVLKTEFRHYIETKNWFDDGSFNSKVIVMQPECFLEVLADLKNIKINGVLSKPELTQILNDIFVGKPEQVKNDIIKFLPAREEEYEDLSVPALIKLFGDCGWEYILEKLGLRVFTPFCQAIVKKANLDEKITTRLTNIYETIASKFK